MLIGYILPTRGGPSVETQRLALREAGVEDDRVVYVEAGLIRRKGKVLPDHLAMRREMIRAVRRGADDVVVVSSLDRLGLTTADILGAVDAISRKGGAILDVSAGETYRWHPDATGLVAAAARAERALMLERTAKARQAGKELGFEGGRPKALASKKKLAEAKRLWPDQELSAKAVSKLVGVSVRTLYRELGPRSEQSAERGPKPRPRK
jgi:DNA invertase Pin-like site-specific DNA recombinase